MNKHTCPLCESDLAMGWWCDSCKLTYAKAAWQKRFNDAMQPSVGDYMMPILIGVSLAAILFIVTLLTR